MRTKPSVWDFFAVAIVLLVALLLWFPFGTRENASVLVIQTPEGSTEYSLSDDREISVFSRGYTLQISIVNGEVLVKKSDCPDGVCAASGKISYAGQSILCAPAGVMLTVRGESDDVDFVAG